MNLEAAQAVSGAIYILTITVVGIRLMLLARRTRALPELLLGLALILGGTLGGPLEAAGTAAKAEFSPETAGRLLLFGKIFGTFALACHVGFIRRVFRPDERWALVLSGGIVGSIVAGFVGAGMSGAFATAELPLICFWVDLAARLIGSAWLVFEGARYHGLMRRRLELGLADPVIVNRFLIWTVAGVCSILFLLTSVPPVFLDQQRFELLLAMDVLAFSIAGISVSVFYLLAFLPPAAYVRWVSGATRTH